VLEVSAGSADYAPASYISKTNERIFDLNWYWDGVLVKFHFGLKWVNLTAILNEYTIEIC
jgi:hypothetical protein